MVWVNDVIQDNRINEKNIALGSTLCAALLLALI